MSQKVLDKRLELWIKENIASVLPDTYLFDDEELRIYSESRGGHQPLNPEIMFNLDGEVSGVYDSINELRTEHQLFFRKHKLLFSYFA